MITRKYAAAFRHLDVHQLFESQRVTPIVAHRIEIIEAVIVGHVLQECCAARSFHGLMQIAHDRFQADDGFAIENDRGAEYAMRGWMLRSHVHNNVISLDARVNRLYIFASAPYSARFAIERELFPGSKFWGNCKLSL